MAKINISIDDDLLNRMDNVADKNYMSRSGLIAYAVSQYLNQQDALLALPEIALCLRKVADTGTIDEETQKKLQDFEYLCKMAT